MNLVIYSMAHYNILQKMTIPLEMHMYRKHVLLGVRKTLSESDY